MNGKKMKRKSIFTILVAMQCFSLTTPVAASAPAAVVTPPTQSVPPTTVPPQGVATSLPSSQVFPFPLEVIQKALDDGSAIVLMTDNDTSIVCTANNGIGRLIIAEKPTCETINPKGGKGTVQTDNVLGFSSSKGFNWKEGSKSNPDEWYTLNGQPATSDANNPNLGICGIKTESLRPKQVGIAVKGNNQPHQCVFSDKNLPLADPSILVLVK